MFAFLLLLCSSLCSNVGWKRCKVVLTTVILLLHASYVCVYIYIYAFLVFQFRPWHRISAIPGFLGFKMYSTYTDRIRHHQGAIVVCQHGCGMQVGLTGSATTQTRHLEAAMMSPARGQGFHGDLVIETPRLRLQGLLAWGLRDLWPVKIANLVATWWHAEWPTKACSYQRYPNPLKTGFRIFRLTQYSSQFCSPVEYFWQCFCPKNGILHCAHCPCWQVDASD